MITPHYLKKGDTIGILCPAGYMAYERAQTCIEALKDWGYNVRIGNTLGGSSQNYFSGNDEERLTDLQQMLDDPEISAILCARGGYGLGRIIDRINFKKFRKNPKWIIGFSDVTVLHAHIYTNFQIASLHAPMAGAFNDGGKDTPYIKFLKESLEGIKGSYTTIPHELNRSGKAKAEIVGGNLSLLAHLCGTASSPDTADRILFIEDVGEYLYNVDRMMSQLKRNKKLNKLAGLVVGGFTEMKDTDRPIGKTVYELIREAVEEFEYPVCFNFPISHGLENVTIKHGLRYQIKVGDSVSLIEK